MREIHEAYSFLSHSGHDGNNEFLAGVEVILNLFADITLGDLDIILGSAIRSHEIEESVINVNLFPDGLPSARSVERGSATYERVFSAADVGDIHVVGGRRDIFL